VSEICSLSENCNFLLIPQLLQPWRHCRASSLNVHLTSICCGLAVQQFHNKLHNKIMRIKNRRPTTNAQRQVVVIGPTCIQAYGCRVYTLSQKETSPFYFVTTRARCHPTSPILGINMPQPTTSRFICSHYTL